MLKNQFSNELLVIFLVCFLFFVSESSQSKENPNNQKQKPVGRCACDGSVVGQCYCLAMLNGVKYEGRVSFVIGKMAKPHLKVDLSANGFAVITGPGTAFLVDKYANTKRCVDERAVGRHNRETPPDDEDYGGDEQPKKAPSVVFTKRCFSISPLEITHERIDVLLMLNQIVENGKEQRLPLFRIRMKRPVPNFGGR